MMAPDLRGIHNSQFIKYDEDACAFCYKDDEGMFWVKTPEVDNEYDFEYHRVDGPALMDYDRDNLFFLDDVRCYTAQEWGNALVEKGYKTKSEAALLVLKWS
jgi:hypothetical protein